MKEDRDTERGFSLVELMVVVLVIAVLITIAIPTFFGAREKTNDRAIQANVRIAFAATRVFYNENLKYSADPTAMTGVEPSLKWTAGALSNTSPERAIQIAVFDVPTEGQTVVVAGRTSSGRCFYLRDVMGGTIAGTYYQRDVTGATQCPTIDPSSITGVSWEG